MKTIKQFTRYSEFQNTFGVNLKNYSQNTVNNGNKGDYLQLLYELREMMSEDIIKTTQPILDKMRSLGINTSLPGLVQVLRGLGIISKVNGQNYLFNVNRIDSRLAAFLFEYNHFKQKILNSKVDDGDVSDIIKVVFGNFEERICGINTYQEKRNKIQKVKEQFKQEQSCDDLALRFSKYLLSQIYNITHGDKAGISMESLLVVFKEINNID